MKKICAFFLALAVFLLPEMVYAANATPQAVNMPHVYIVFGVLFVAAVLFFTEWIPLAVTSILVPCALSTLGVITVKEAWVSFGDTSILTIVGLFMLGEATSPRVLPSEWQPRSSTRQGPAKPACWSSPFFSSPSCRPF